MAFLNEQGVERLWQHVVAKIEDSGGTTIPITTERPADLPANSLWFDTDEPTPEGANVELPDNVTYYGEEEQENNTASLFADKEKTSPIFPRTKVKAISDDNGVGLNVLLDEKASVQKYSVIIGSTWTGSAAPYTQEITVNGIIADDTPIVDVIMSGTYAIDETRLAEWGKIYRIVTAANKITVYAKEATTAELPIQLQVVR